MPVEHKPAEYRTVTPYQRRHAAADAAVPGA